MISPPIQEIIDNIQEHDTVIIYRHKKPDLDAVGAQHGLAALIKNNFDNKTVFCPGEIPDTLKRFVPADAVTDNAPDSVYDNQVLSIVVDTADIKRIDGNTRFNVLDKVIKIDHHPEQDRYENVSWVDTGASSASEMIAVLAKEAQWSHTDLSAQLLCLGIIGDIGRFLYNNVSPDTLRVTADLVEHDFSYSDLNDNINRISLNVAKLQGWALTNLAFDKKSGLGVIHVTDDVLERFGVSHEDAYNIVNVPKDIDGMRLWMVIISQGDGTSRISLRSNSVPVSDIAADFGGGGHALAAGVVVGFDDVVPVIDRMYERGLSSAGETVTRDSSDKDCDTVGIGQSQEEEDGFLSCQE